MFELAPAYPSRSDLDWCWYLRKQGASGLPVDRYHYLLNWDWSDPTMPKHGPGNGSLPVTYIGYS